MSSLATAWKVYREEQPATRLHVLLRALTCPFGAFLTSFPHEGRVLDVGCGHGLLLNLLSRDPARAALRLHGIDHDGAKIAIARRTAGPAVIFSTSGLKELDAGAYDVVVLVDVLYTIPLGQWAGMLGECRRVLRPGGQLIVKEVVNRPRWKYWAIMAQESLSVRVFGITKGTPPHFESSAAYCRALADAGFTVDKAMALPAGSWISHHLFRARRLTENPENDRA